MKVLFITHHYLHLSGGGSFASRAFINAFAELADECVLLYPDNGQSIKPYINDRVQLMGVRNKISNLGKIADLYIGRINRFYNILFPTVNKLQPDIVVFDNSLASSGYIKKLKKQNIKVITIHHNYEMEYYKGTPPNILWRVPLMYYIKKTEKEAVLYSDLNLCLTGSDIQLLKKNYDLSNQSVFEKIGIFEYKTNSNSVPIFNNKANENIVFAITGSLSSYQTETSLFNFFNNYYPIILKLLPDSFLIVAGKNPSNKIKDICSQYSNIQLIPNPENMSAVISEADIYINPTNVGGGIKLRTMDGLKLGLPVISHTISSRGYEAFEKANILYRYDNKHQFEESLKKLIHLNKTENFNKNKILEIYKSLFSFNAGVKRLKDILRQYSFI